jgi:hypothetical protein
MSKLIVNQPPPAPPPTYTLELSKEEAEGLARLLYAGVSGQVITALQLAEMYEQLKRLDLHLPKQHILLQNTVGLRQQTPLCSATYKGCNCWTCVALRQQTPCTSATYKGCNCWTCSQQKKE